LRRANSPDEAVKELIALAHEGGAPDNIACVVAEVVTL
jgi:protein phosphatase